MLLKYFQIINFFHFILKRFAEFYMFYNKFNDFNFKSILCDTFI